MSSNDIIGGIHEFTNLIHPHIQLHSPRLNEHLMNSMMSDDQFYASYTYDQVMEHHDWHDGSEERGKPAYDLPRRARKTLSGAKTYRETAECQHVLEDMQTDNDGEKQKNQGSQRPGDKGRGKCPES